MRALPTRLLVVALCALTFAGCSAEDDRRSGAPPSDSDLQFDNVSGDVAFVGDETCATCHNDEYAGYQAHGMANSMAKVEDAGVLGPLPSPPVYHEASDLYYRAFEENGRFFQEEYRLARTGRRVHRLVRSIDWVVGSGNAARTYLTVENGHYAEMPLTWYTQRQTWDLSPGYEDLNNRFSREIPDRCMACHNAYPEAVPFVKGKYVSVPEGISCERCHGPGELHVDARLANPDPAGDIDRTIVNPIHLDLERRLDVCQQCHLNGTVSILREGRSPFQFRPSEALSSHISLFGQPEGEFKVISHAERMMRSACFIATQGTDRAMDCLTCHDPHEGFRDAGPEYFDETCKTCHDTSTLAQSVAEEFRDVHTAASGCFSCHMPREAASDVPHSSFTDHWIRVVGRTDQSSTGVADVANELRPYFDRDRETREGDVYEGVAYFVLGKTQGDIAAVAKSVDILRGTLTESDSLGDAWYQLGFGLVTLERFEEAERPLEQAVRLGPDIPERLNTLALLYERLRRPQERIEGLYRHALDVQPQEAAIRVNYGRFLETQGRDDEAAAHYRQALQDTPTLPAAHYNMGTLLIKRGDLEGGRRALEAAIGLDPDYEDALGNLAVLLATTGDNEQALVYFQRAVDADPGDPVALNNLASFYLNNGRDAEALPLLRRAVERRPDYVDAVVNLSLALLRTGRDREALQTADRALQLDPGNRLAAQIRDALR